MANILLIDSNLLLSNMYTIAMQQAGYHVRHVLSGQAGIDAADEQKPALVILDAQLPQHSGIEFLHEFRSYSEWQKVPVILTGNLTPSRIAAVQSSLNQDLGVRVYLYKPRTSLLQLLRIIREQLAGIV